uniref:Uncharacterized protein n=1 Tax=viral metagenome TaxID=1070528 RepID=A0A6M3LWA1_9ZZZZ
MRICPKCGKPLKLIKLKASEFYGHSYTLRHVIADKPMCDYSKQVYPPAMS